MAQSLSDGFGSIDSQAASPESRCDIPATASATRRRSAGVPQHSSALSTILVASWILRVALASRGGQYFFPDEGRFARSMEVVALLARGHVLGAARTLLTSTDHGGWVLIGTVPAAVEGVLSSITGRHASDYAYVAAIMLSLASVGIIFMIFTIARRLGATPVEALIASAVAAASTSLFYWSRHLMPYDSSMLLALIGLRVGLGPPSDKRFLVCGLCAGSAFLVYNGYWILAATAIAVPSIVGAQHVRTVARRLGLAGAALMAPTLAFLVLANLLGGGNAFASAREFASTVVQGDWDDGFSLPIAYLWSTEHGLLIIGLAALLLVVTSIVRRSDTHPASRVYRDLLSPDWSHARASRGVLLASVIIGIYLLLAGGAAITHTFVVYGRLARQIMPFLCLLIAWATRAGSTEEWRRRSSAIALAVAILSAVLGFWRPFVEVFPRELEAQLVAYYPLGHALSVSGPKLQGNPDGRYVLVNGQFIYFPREPLPAVPGTLIVAFPHPLTWKPYQYEGCTRVERAILDSQDLSMRLVDTHPSQ